MTLQTSSGARFVSRFYPFALSFPVERVVREAEDSLLARLESFETIDRLEVEIPAGDPGQELVARFKLRPVLVIHDGTDRAIQDVAVARITSVKGGQAEAKERWYKRLSQGTHATQYLLPQGSLALRDAEHGSYIDAGKVAVIPKASMLRRVGVLNESQMKDISERLIRALEIDVSSYVAEIVPRETS